MITAYILDYYIGDGTEANPYRSASMDALSGTITLVEPVDIAQIIPNPNIVTVRAEVEDIAQIENHADYGPGAILYDTPNPYRGDEKPNANEHGKRRAHCAKLGMSQALFVAMFGSTSHPKTRKDATNNLIAWQRTLPRRTV